ncbi:ATP-binding protein [Candidatus Pacearchaeota archaeon]|nr:ATP-binding protein [Candidatus Pacearchaeota archaeon]
MAEKTDKNYIPRFLESKISKYLDKKEVIAIVGARQCGKTTLMKHILLGLKNAKFITFEDREILEFFSKDLKSFIELYVKNNKYLFIDEFQYAKQGGKQLKYIYDNFDVKIIISGSSSSDLSIHSIKYLVGRIFVFTLYPFSFGEFLSYKDGKLYYLYKKKDLSSQLIGKVNQYYEEFVTYGGYPRVIISNDKEEKIEVLKNIYNTYFLKEIKEILQLQEDFKLSRLIKLLAIQTGSIANYHELSSSTDFSYHDLMKNLNILKKTFICIENRPFFTNKRKEIVKSPKYFFLDNGFRNIILNNFQRLEERTDKGAINENFVASELVKSDIELRYWKTKAGAEVDFILEKDGIILPLEIKTTLKNKNITRSFRSFIEEYSPKKGIVLSTEFSGKMELKKSVIEFFPIFQISTLISDR